MPGGRIAVLYACSVASRQCGGVGESNPLVVLRLHAPPADRPDTFVSDTRSERFPRSRAQR
jgi:hypothetical protein